MKLSRSILLAVLFCAAQTHAQALLHLTFAEGQPPNGKVYGVAAEQAQTTVSVINGQRVVLQRKSGRDFRLQGAEQSWSLTQVQQVALNETTISVAPRIDGDSGNVTVEVIYSSTKGDKTTSYTSTVGGELGSWILLIGGPPAGNDRDSKVYSAGDLSQQLSLRVER